MSPVTDSTSCQTRTGRPDLIDYRQQLGGEAVQVDLLAQPGAEPRDRLAGVVAAPVEAPVHRPLDAPAGRLEQGGHRQGRAGHHHGRVPAEQLASPRTTPA
jgi:hypothetical protein